MATSAKDKLIKSICPHRGLGEENSLLSISSGLLKHPFFLEFDIRYYDGQVLLGHPPHVGKLEVLTEALTLFEKSRTFPKIDLRIPKLGWESHVKALCKVLKGVNQKVIVNIGGEIGKADPYMAAEVLVDTLTKSNILLNIDLARYFNKSSSQIDQHIESLVKLPFSISPNIESNIELALKTATQHDIKVIGLWMNVDSSYTLEELFKIYTQIQKAGLTPILDIYPDRIKGLDYTS